VAEFEREIIRERVNSGLRAARARGVRLGRPAILVSHLPQVRTLIEGGRCVAEIARDMGLAYSSAHKLVSLAKTVTS
jgi:DNA invertase Pin-like site-specific DNA recombinase